MGLKLGDSFPDFSVNTSQGELRSFHDWIDNSWAIFFSHPADFTPVCTTELARAVQLYEEFEKRNVKLIALSCDSVKSHKQWIPDILHYGTQVLNAKNTENFFPFPIIADENRELANLLGMIDPNEIDSNGLPLTARAVFIIDPLKKLKLSILYPATTGRNFDEILRVVDSLQLTTKTKVATPVDWKVGQQCAIIPNVDSLDAEKMFGEKNIQNISLPSKKNYLRLVQLDITEQNNNIYEKKNAFKNDQTKENSLEKINNESLALQDDLNTKTLTDSINNSSNNENFKIKVTENDRYL